jgi:sigma-B regulation protein RsbU (phosphoserine phosphatase)
VELRHKILIVGDERFNINVLVDLLKPNYRVVAAIGGKQALKAARSDNPPDLILLDIRMPKLDGDEVCRQLMTDAATRDIPIIVVTAMGQTEDETGGLELGAVDDLTMPISAAVVEARVRSQLAVKKNLEDLRSANLVTEAQKERVQKELDAAREIQRAMLTQEFPETDTICVRAELKTAREVGGDLYDVFELDPNRLCFCVGDVSGKGVGAALFMARTVTLIRSRAMNDPSPGSIVTHVNEVLEHDNDACMFVTLWLGILDLQTGVVTYTNGGHPPPYLCTLEGRVEALTARHE